MQKTNTGVWGTVVGTELAKEVRLRMATFMQCSIEHIRALSVSKPVHSVKSLICPSYELCNWQKDSKGMIQDVEHTGSKCLIIWHYQMDPKLESSMIEEDFTLSHRFHVDSRWTFNLFFLGVSPANSLSRIHLESIWSPPGVHLSIWTPPWNTGKYEFSKPDSIWTPHVLITFYCIISFSIKNKKSAWAWIEHST